MQSTLFQFGRRLPGYEVPVLNERAVRAGAGILFLPAFVSFMNAWLLGNFQPTRVFVVAFLLDFAIRLFLNPRWAPSLIVGQWLVRQQQPEWVGAPQKRWAWAIGFGLAATMLYLVVIQQLIGPVNLFVCALCLTLLFFESAFGICLGCKLYTLLHKEQARLCPGNVCDDEAEKGDGVDGAQILLVLLFAGTVAAVAQWVYRGAPPMPASVGPAPASAPAAALDPAEAERCKVPDFAKAIGHEEMWKLHHHCK